MKPASRLSSAGAATAIGPTSQSRRHEVLYQQALSLSFNLPD
jgi:hypothetical protein